MARREIAQALQRNRGQQPLYDEEIADEILARLSTGEGLKTICRDAHMPHEATVRDWVRDDRGGRNGREGFATLYARAREMGCDSIADGILEIGIEDYRGPDGYVDNGEIQRLRLISDNRKWLLTKFAPKKYGDKVTQEITGEDGGALITRIELVPVAARPRPLIEHDNSVNGSPVEARTPKGTRKRQKP